MSLPRAASQNACILLFLRAPEIGRVKTRLARTIGDVHALALYRLFVQDMIDTLTATHIPLFACCHPADKLPFVASWLGPALHYRPQRGNCLGERMAAAFRTAFSEGFERAALVGSDLPDLPADLLHAALEALDHRGAALGPGTDGGYYLVAFRKSAFTPEIFCDIPWGTDRVLDRTLATFEAMRLPVALLPQWADVDTIADLRALWRKPCAAESRTRTWLRAHQDIFQQRKEA